MNSLLIAKNMMRRTLGQKKGWLLCILLPALAVSLVIKLLGSDSDGSVKIDYVNLDRGSFGSYLVQELSRKPHYRLNEVKSEEELKERVVRRQTNAAFVIPAEFTNAVMSGADGKVSLYQLNLSEASFTLKLNLEQEISRMKAAVQTVKAAAGNGGDAQSRLEQLFAEQAKHNISAVIAGDRRYAGPVVSTSTGILLLFMMVLGNGSISTILEDRRQRTMMRIYAAPVRPYEIALGNFIGSLLLGTMQIVIVLLFTRLALGFDYGVGFLEQLAVLECFLLASVGLAGAIAGLVRNSNNLGTINSLVVTPTCMIGGCFWPVDIMPDFLQKLSNFVPQKWAIEAITSMAAGSTLADVGLEIGILALFAAVLLTFGSVVLKPGDAETM